MKISIKTEKEIEKMRVAGKLAAEVLEMIEPFVVPGVSTEELDKTDAHKISLSCHKFSSEMTQLTILMACIEIHQLTTLG